MPPFRIRADSAFGDQLQTTALRPFLEDSDWTPSAIQQVVVDDLDEGFSVTQPEATSDLFISATPLTWFSRNALRIFEEDQGLSVYNGWVPGMPAEIWHRTLDVGSYGRHRKTTTIAWIPRAKPPRKVSFVANVPVSATWVLEYHLPIAWSTSGYSDLTYNLSVHNDERDWNVPFDTSSEGVSSGWNSVDKFDLNAGTVTVDVLGTESRGLMFADAIRWTIVPDESEVKNIEH